MKIWRKNNPKSFPTHKLWKSRTPGLQDLRAPWASGPRLVFLWGKNCGSIFLPIFSSRRGPIFPLRKKTGLIFSSCFSSGRFFLRGKIRAQVFPLFFPRAVFFLGGGKSGEKIIPKVFLPISSGNLGPLAYRTLGHPGPQGRA